MHDLSTCENGIRMTMSATVENVDWAEECITDILGAYAERLDIFSVRLLLREALLNAVIHGSGKDAKKIVTLELGVDETCVRLIVEDSGSGFACQGTEHHADLVSDGGRGLPIMETYSDRMTYNDKGNQVILCKDYRADAGVECSAALD